jgi:hypothetical protein
VAVRQTLRARVADLEGALGGAQTQAEAQAAAMQQTEASSTCVRYLCYPWPARDRLAGE